MYVCMYKLQRKSEKKTTAVVIACTSSHRPAGMHAINANVLSHAGLKPASKTAQLFDLLNNLNIPISVMRRFFFLGGLRLEI